MAVHYVGGGGGGFFGNLMKGLQMASMFVPGMQPFAPFIGAAGALAQGDVGGAVGSAAGGALGNVFRQPAAVAAQPQTQAVANAASQASNQVKGGGLTNAWLKMYNQPVVNAQTQPDYFTDPMIGGPSRWQGRRAY